MTERKLEEVKVVTGKEESEKTVRLNINPSLPVSKSLLEIAARSPTAAISSVAALFIVVILSIVIPVMFSPCQNQS